MTNQSRRKFLLFASQVGLLSVLGCDGCWPLPQVVFPPSGQSNFNVDEEKLKRSITEKLKSGKQITVDWDCGGDEAIMSLYQDGKEIPWDSEFGGQLRLYLGNFLNLPDVGEFHLEGKGQLILENDLILLEYESYLKGYQDYTASGEDLGWKKVNQLDEDLSGRTEILKN